MSLSKLQHARDACWARRHQEPNSIIIEILHDANPIHTFIPDGDLDNLALISIGQIRSGFARMHGPDLRLRIMTFCLFGRVSDPV